MILLGRATCGAPSGRIPRGCWFPGLKAWASIGVGNLAGTYAIGLPAAVGLGLIAHFGFLGVFAAKAIEEIVKVTCFFLRFHSPRWYANAVREERQSARQ
jgi:Na+-driven multidrug efflux pump